MESQHIHRHWTDWATTHGTDLKATTRTPTAKRLELEALFRNISLELNNDEPAILEVGCGNGINCVELANRIPGASCDGVDFVQEMVNAASDNAQAAGVADRVRFYKGDVTKLATHIDLRKEYDCVFTDRCIINLNTIEKQLNGISALASKVASGGYLMMIENSSVSYGLQNDCRLAVGLEARTPASFNLFLDEAALLQRLQEIGFFLERIEDFSSLHDLALYVLVPAINGGKVDYDHPIVEAATRLSLVVAGNRPSSFGPYGQNRLFVTRRTA